MNIDSDDISQKSVENINRITTFLNEFEKEYEVKMWESGEGWDVIVKEYDVDTNNQYYTTISLRNNGYLSFEKTEEEK